MTKKDMKYRQGRSKRQQAGNEAIGYYATVGAILLIAAIIIYNVLTVGIPAY